MRGLGIACLLLSAVPILFGGAALSDYQGRGCVGSPDGMQCSDAWLVAVTHLPFGAFLMLAGVVLLRRAGRN